MADIVWNDVTAVAPELSTVSAGAQADLLSYVNTHVDPAKLGGVGSPKYRLARIYLAAHMATMSSQGGVGVAGPVISESAGGLSRSYALLNAQSGFSGSTYGDMYRHLIRTSAARAPLVT
jgi:hypothetical protein